MGKTLLLIAAERGYVPLGLTFRELLQSINPAITLDALDARHGDSKSREGYERVIAALLAYPAKEPPLPILLSFVACSDFDDGDWISVDFWNPAYTQPPADLEPICGLHGKPVPEGCYNAEADQYQTHFAMGFTDWADLIDSTIWFQDEANCRRLAPTLDHIAAEILWEITFYGFDQAGIQEVKDSVMGAMDEYFASKEGEEEQK
jgi:hypothetical protein